MPKKSLWTPKILEHLREESLIAKDLYDNVSQEIMREKKDIGKAAKKSFFDSIMNLLKENKIEIKGYDASIVPKTHRQSFYYWALIFGLIRTNIFEILHLINQLDNPNVEEVKNAYHELEILFRIKIREYEDKQYEMWKKINADVEIEPLRGSFKVGEEKSTLYEDYDFKIMQNIESIYKSLGMQVQISTPYGELNYILLGDLIRSILDKRMFNDIIKDFNEELVLILIFKRLYADILKDHPNARRIYLNAMKLPKINFFQEYISNTDLRYGILDLNGSIDFKTFLSIFEIKNPEKMSENEIESLFRKITFETLTKKENQFLKFSLANALSGSKESLEWIEQFIEKTTENFPKRVEEISRYMYNTRIMKDLKYYKSLNKL